MVLLMPLDLDPHSCPQGNYVPNRDELVEAQTPEYDVVLCLSLTKWVHLNWGDEGLKRMFRRIYRHLRPGGILVLEPQPWSSYGKRKTLTETIYKNYYRIQLKPEQFSSYLTSPEVGFSSYELVVTPHNTSKGKTGFFWGGRKKGWVRSWWRMQTLWSLEVLPTPPDCTLSSQASSVLCTCSTRPVPPATKWPPEQQV